jgi:hypothetical protein
MPSDTQYGAWPQHAELDAHDCPLQLAPPSGFWHEPFRQIVTPLQALPKLCHWPLESHCCGCDTEHWVDPGGQTPAQLPLLQT